MISALEALEKLREGNHRFVSGGQQLALVATQMHREALIESQNPFAIILGCSDSRVPAEIVFDQGLGELFVIRVAGNIVAPSQVGSVEFAAETLGTRLVVVMGHSNCSAVRATVEELQQPTEGHSSNLQSIVGRIRPSVEELLLNDPGENTEELIDRAVRANVRHSADHLRHGSAVLERLIEEEGLLVVGAEYSIETGEVDFFDGMPVAGL